MRVLVLGGGGRLGRHVTPILEGLGHTVSSPASSEVDAASYEQVLNKLNLFNPEIVLSMAAYTNVSNAKKEYKQSIKSNVTAALKAARACEDYGVTLVWVSTDYVFHNDGPHPPNEMPSPQGFYGLTKAMGEVEVLLHHKISHVARMCFTDPDDVIGYGWLNGYTRSTREWIETASERLSKWIVSFDFKNSNQRVHHLVKPGSDTTLAKMALERWPEHPGAICSTMEQIASHAGSDYLPPTDTRLSDPVFHLDGE